MSIRVLLADDQELIRLGLRLFLDTQNGIDVVGEAQDGAEAVARAAELRPDVVIMDIRMPVLDGVAATTRLTAPGLDHTPRVLILTTFDLDEYVYGALRAGAAGFLLKDAPRERLLEAIRVVDAGDALLSPTVTRRLIQEFAARPPVVVRPSPLLDSLTPREHEVLVLVARGLTNGEIAERLVVTEATVKSHLGRVLAKVGARDRVQLVIFAYANGLASTDRNGL
ncbi:response regulator [Plantactinospora endophytica]|uniref:DNA-binding response regulator n=1 Tax=Plantactinospora endophytica TaxID=673535 RepID=A0ABQ4ED72_9ACTN|nr:response regulator transcription factor [Plantactinospora endophytica]GIG92678.1 DNA-binding response regulator [Plantactinospora endophytica]